MERMSYTLIILSMGLVFTGCPNIVSPPPDSPTAVAFSGLTANGTSGTVTTTALTLTFDVDPTSLAAGDITVTGATKGVLSGTGTNRSLGISAITVANGASVTVAIADPAGFTILPASRTVVVNVAVIQSADADLQALAVSQGTLSPAFSPSTTDYRVDVAFGVTSITVTGTKSDANATLDGPSGQSVNLLVGDTAITLVVTAEDGIATRAYVVTVHRAAADPSLQIQTARDSPDGSTSLSVENATVTYVLATGAPATKNYPGFFVQGGPAGPALYVAVDPATLTPPPAVGDSVSFMITAMGTDYLMRNASTVDSYTRLAQGADIATLVRNVSNVTDLVSAVSSYESEVISVTGTVATSFISSGTGMLSARLSTTGLPNEPNLQVRMPSTLQSALGLAVGWVVRLNAVPLWRMNALAHLNVWVAEDISVISHP
jgi:hypothetical protein